MALTILQLRIPSDSQNREFKFGAIFVFLADISGSRDSLSHVHESGDWGLTVSSLSVDLYLVSCKEHSVPKLKVPKDKPISCSRPYIQALIVIHDFRSQFDKQILALQATQRKN